MEHYNDSGYSSRYVTETHHVLEKRSPDEYRPPNDFELDTMYINDHGNLQSQYYEKDGLRADGEGYEHTVTKLNTRTKLALLAMSFLWTGSQIPVYLFGGIPPEIYTYLGGADRWIWMVLGNLLALAAVCPFVGALSDLLGRRYVAIMGSCFIILGMVVTSTASNMNHFIGGMTIAGIGGGINELISLAGTAELAPTSKRGTYVGAMIFTILPWCPAVVYAQLITKASSFRYVGLLCAVWSFVGLVLTVLFYFPPPRPNSEGCTTREILRRIDYVGGFLSIGGVLLFLLALEWGGYNYEWGSAHVLIPLILGILMMILFCVWEKYGTNYPMIPSRLKKNSRVLNLILVIIFISGANFFSLLFFWPTQAFNMYDNDPVGVGLRCLPIGFSILAGALAVLLLLGITGGRIKLLMIIASVIMTAGTGSLSIARPDNMHIMWGLVVLAGLGIGGIIIPASIISTIVCPDDLIGTVIAIGLSIRVLGGAIGYTIYYNVFYNKFYHVAFYQVGLGVGEERLGISNYTLLDQIVHAAGNAQFSLLRQLIAEDPYASTLPYAYDLIVSVTQWAFADAYKWVYYISIAFGCLSIIASCLLGDIEQYMDDHVAVVME